MAGQKYLSSQIYKGFPTPFPSATAWQDKNIICLKSIKGSPPWFFFFHNFFNYFYRKEKGFFDILELNFFYKWIILLLKKKLNLGQWKVKIIEKKIISLTVCQYFLTRKRLKINVIDFPKWNSIFGLITQVKGNFFSETNFRVVSQNKTFWNAP